MKSTALIIMLWIVGIVTIGFTFAVSIVSSIITLPLVAGIGIWLAIKGIFSQELE